MNDLEMFLALPDVNSIEKEIFVSKRLGNFKIRAMTSEEFSEYQKRCTKKVNKKGLDIDINKLNTLIVAGQVIAPDFSNAEFLKKVNCSTATEFISKKLLIGEIAEISRQVQILSGFDEDITEDIDEAKN
jgi:hypothetical protein